MSGRLTTLSKRTSRAQLPISGGLGTHYTSPVKKRDKRKTQGIVTLGQANRHKALMAKLEALRNPTPSSPGEGSHDPHISMPCDLEPPFDNSITDTMDVDTDVPATQPNINLQAAYEIPATNGNLSTPNASQSDEAVQRQFASWMAVLPTLVKPLLSFCTSSIGTVPNAAGDFQSRCGNVGDTCRVREHHILCLHFQHFKTITVTVCGCRSVAGALIINGLFPASPVNPNVAVSIDLLEFYRALFERSCDAVGSMAAALHTFYDRRGFHLLNKKGGRLLDPFRRSLGQAVQWYDTLRVRLEKEVDAIVESSAATLPKPEPTPDTAIPATSTDLSAPSTLLKPEPAPNTPIHGLTTGLKNTSSLSNGQAAKILQDRCPACFGQREWGRSFQQGGDVHVGTDGNFHHRHQASAGDGPRAAEPSWFLPKAQVDAVGRRMEQLRKSPPRPYKPVVPNEAVDSCKESYDAADGDKKKASTDKFDDTGLMCLVCRHDIPLFFANIDTPGEQQKYSVALIEHLYSLLPPEATVAVLYDVGCVLDRSLQLYEILPIAITERLQFATSAMHAYGHQWACQLVYNPRLREGLGLTDGEGVERLWSRLRRLIGIERSQWRSRRLWLIDRQASSICGELRDDLGHWLVRRLQQGVQRQGNNAQETLKKCGIPTSILRSEWADQKAAQMSIRAHAPTRLKKELDIVLSLQGELDVVETSITNAKTTISKAGVPNNSIELISSLQRNADRLKTKVEQLYASLNVHDSFPELKSISLEFVRTLMMARDLKINIRKRAIGSFFEWDKLDQAAGGRAQALGTKLHQQTRKAIAKRRPALLTAIRKFNQYCETLEELYQPEWSIPLPLPLSTKLATLRDDPGLMEDVWITPSEGTLPRWLEDLDVREGIRAMLKYDRCQEEHARLKLEARNMGYWHTRELAAVEAALQNPLHTVYQVSLKQRHAHLVQLRHVWTSPLLPTTLLGTQNHIPANYDMPSVCVDVTTFTDIEDPKKDGSQATDSDHASQDTPQAALDLEPDEALIRDIIEVDDDDVVEITNIIDTTQLDIQSDAAEFIWELPTSINVDSGMRVFLDATFGEHLGPSDSSPRPRILHGSKEMQVPSVQFDPVDIGRLTSPTALLNDICLNGGARLLQDHISQDTFESALCAQRCALLTTHDLPRIRYSASDAEVWRHLSGTQYWARDIWILPIHRPYPEEHWVCSIISITHHRIYLFDSLGRRRGWRRDTQDIMFLISRMIILANQNDHPLHLSTKDWTAQPLVIQALQHNGYDCGLWVLACIAATLRGFDLPSLSEEEITYMRRFILEEVLRLPHLANKSVP